MSASSKRERWLRERRRATMERYDDLHAPTYDHEYGKIGIVHRGFVLRLVDACPPGSVILDAACGTGKYFDLIRARGRRVVGFDQSRGMLREARKRDSGALAVVRLQDLAVRSPFVGTMCVDALECLPPEDWPGVIWNLARATAPGGTVYLTVERTSPRVLAAAQQRALELGFPVVPGEDAGEVGYHYYPSKTAVRRWLAQGGLSPIREHDEREAGGGYWHLLCRVATVRQPAGAKAMRQGVKSRRTKTPPRKRSRKRTPS